MSIKVLTLKDFRETLVVIAFDHETVLENLEELENQICTSIPIAMGDINWVYLNQDGSFRLLRKENEDDARIMTDETMNYTTVLSVPSQSYEEHPHHPLPKDSKCSVHNHAAIISGSTYFPHHHKHLFKMQVDEISVFGPKDDGSDL